MRSILQLTPKERETIFSIAESITGTCQHGKYRRDVLVTNVARRIRETKCASLSQYLSFIEGHRRELDKLISALTIHTTSWFREAPHFRNLANYLRDNFDAAHLRKCKILSIGCATGEESYSIAMECESFRRRNPGFEYEISGVDIDPISIDSAKQGVFLRGELEDIPPQHRELVVLGSGDMAEFFTVHKDIRSRCRFSVANIARHKALPVTRFDIIFCRNLLIYFQPGLSTSIVARLIEILEPNGILVTGHSETIDSYSRRIKNLGNTTYQLLSPGELPTDQQLNLRRALVVDDSPTARTVITRVLQAGNFKAISVGSADEATKFLAEHEVDLVTLDLQMPGLDGGTWLRTQRHSGMRIPVVVVTSASPNDAFEIIGALENGAQDYIDKERLKEGSEEIVKRLEAIVESYRGKRYTSAPSMLQGVVNFELARPDCILVGASTGGPEALVSLLEQLPDNTPPVIVVQHISKSFARPFARRLAKASGLILGEPIDGVKLERDTIYLAHSDYHIGVTSRAGSLYLKIDHSGPIGSHKPSVDYLFHSAAQIKHKAFMGILLTGMGNDGAKGLRELRAQGGMTLVQDEGSAVVFGMPREAIKLGAAGFVGDPLQIRHQLNRAIAVDEE